MEKFSNRKEARTIQIVFKRAVLYSFYRSSVQKWSPWNARENLSKPPPTGLGPEMRTFIQKTIIYRLVDGKIVVEIWGYLPEVYTCGDVSEIQEIFR